MMYPESMRAVLQCYTGSGAAVRKPIGAAEYRSGKCPIGSKTLGNAEVAAIRKYYPRKAKLD